MLDEQAKKTVLRKIPHALYVCGVREGEDLNAFTASWVMQASFKPPLVTVCIRQDSRSHGMVLNSGVFALSFLATGQKAIAEHFFQSVKRIGNRLGDIEFYTGVTGCPIIQAALGYVECQTVGSLAHGDHTVFVGEVVAAGLHQDQEPLLLKETGWTYGG